MSVGSRRFRSATARTRAPSVDARDVALVLGPLVVGSRVGAVTNARGAGWYRRLAKPSWTPPDAAFGPVWSILYLLMGLASAVVARAGRAQAARPDAERQARPGPALTVYALQLALNLGWSLLFFGVRRVKPAGVELVALWASIVATVVAFGRVRPVAGLLLLPYLAWTSFAALLNAEVIRRNPGA